MPYLNRSTQARKKVLSYAEAKRGVNREQCYLPRSLVMPDSQSNYEKTAAVGVLTNEDRLLVIKRSSKVIAPGKICFPGGTVETGESIQQALVREFAEEVALDVEPVASLWTSVTSWRCQVHWWSVACNSSAPVFEEDHDWRELISTSAEVAEVWWKTVPELLAEDDLLESNRQFLDLLVSGEISL